MTLLEQLEVDLGHRVSPSDKADYQFACFTLAKEQGKSPLALAEEMAKKFKSKVAHVEVSPPGFLNFYLTDDSLSKVGKEILKSGNLPLPATPKRLVFFDYGGANVAKELHIGHLRPPIIGEALRRVFMAFGHETIGDTHLGDFGMHMGLLVAELELMDKAEAKYITLEGLNEIYPRASKRKETDEAFKKRAGDLVLLMQQKVEPFYSLWQKIKDVSIPAIRKNYETLGCTFDTFEGDNCEFAPEMIAALKPGSTYMHDGCLLMDVRQDGEHIPVLDKDGKTTFKNPMPPVMLQKENGAVLYLTGDLATIHKRHTKYNASEYVYVVDARQSLHFVQAFRAARKGGLVADNVKLVHVPLGTVNGKDGKPFKTRAGGTIKLEDIINLVTESAKTRLAESGRTADDETAQKIGLAALKFADLQNTVRKDYIFDIDKFTSFEGKTGPYLLYTIARINSILEKADIKKSPLTLNRPIYTAILRLADSFTGAMQNYTLNGIVDATYNLAQEFNNFYAHESIIKGGHTELARLVKIAIEFALNALAIDTVDRM
ncbi:MAG: arginine--tRNA ligase [Firmicutes bacterium]|nr:arginine--tRNA ligase [Bacillota bacterium]